MDVDDTQPRRNSPFINYFDVSTNFPWQEPRPDQIRERRAALLDGLLFDVLLMSGGVEEPYLVYPPEDPQSLQRLLDAIESSTYDTLKKDCLVYFLLKWHQDGRERTFQQQRCIPPQFAALSDAYWHLDTGINIPTRQRAIAILFDARLNRDYASKILHVISISPDPAPLIRRYVQTAKPLLVEPLDIECYALAMADSSISEAWKFARTFNESDPMRARLLKKIVEWTVEPAPRPNALSQLLSLPLSTFEENVFNQFVQKPPPTLKFSGVAMLQDLICVRLIQGGRYDEAIKLDRLFTSITLPRDLQLTKARSKMVRDIYSALPSIERSMIDLELDPNTVQKPPLDPTPPSPPKKQATSAANNNETADLSLSQSWEAVEVPGIVSAQATPLRDVRVPATPQSNGQVNLFASTSTAAGSPLVPLSFNNVASGSKTAPRKSLPLSSSLLGMSSKPRASLSGVGSRMAFGTGSGVVASPASGLKVSMFGASTTTAPQNLPPRDFVSASQQQNAFYKPPPQKTNGVKRAFEEDLGASTSMNDMDVEPDLSPRRETEKEQEAAISPEVTPQSKGRRRGRFTAATEEPEEDMLQYSVFRQSAEPEQGDNDAMDEDHQNKAPKARRTTRGRVSAKSARQEAEPPAKKARQLNESDLGRSLPGGFGEDMEAEEEDNVAPLPSPPRKTAARKLRASMSADSEGDGMQTRRRSSRLTMNGSVHEGSPEPAPKPRKAKRTTTKKKGN